MVGIGSVSFDTLLTQLHLHIHNRPSKQFLVSLFDGLPGLARFLEDNTNLHNFRRAQPGSDSVLEFAKFVNGNEVMWRGKNVDGEWRLGTVHATQGDALPALPAPATQGDTLPALPAPATQGDARPALPAPATQGDARPALPAPATQGDARPALPAPATQGDARPALPAPASPVSLKDLMTFSTYGALGGLAGAALYHKVHEILSQHFGHEIGEAEKRGLTVGTYLAPIVGAVSGTWMGVATTGVVGPGLVPILAAATTGLVVGFMVTGVAATVGWIVDRIGGSRKLLEKTCREMAELRERIQGKWSDLANRLREVRRKLDNADAALAQADSTLRNQPNNMELIQQSYMSVCSWQQEIRRVHDDLKGIADQSCSFASEMENKARDLSRAANEAVERAEDAWMERNTSIGTSACMASKLLWACPPAALAVGVAGAAYASMKHQEYEDRQSEARMLRQGAQEASAAVEAARRINEGTHKSLWKCMELQGEAELLEREFQDRLNGAPPAGRPARRPRPISEDSWDTFEPPARRPRVSSSSSSTDVCRFM